MIVQSVEWDAAEEFSMLHDPNVIPRFAADSLNGNVKKYCTLRVVFRRFRSDREQTQTPHNVEHLFTSFTLHTSSAAQL